MEAKVTRSGRRRACSRREAKAKKRSKGMLIQTPEGILVNGMLDEGP